MAFLVAPMFLLCLLVSLVSTVGCTQQSEKPDDPHLWADRVLKAERVSLGMTNGQVEALIGPSTKSCWNYSRDQERKEVCFRDGKAISYGKWYQNASGVEGWWEQTRGPIPTSFAVLPGDSPRKVLETLGRPSEISESYSCCSGVFVNGRLTKWRGPPAPPAS